MPIVLQLNVYLYIYNICAIIFADKDALSFQPPEMPTLHNFDRLLQEFGGFTFDTEMDLALPIESATHPRLDSNEASRYEVNFLKREGYFCFFYTLEL